jgi:hypothetical protein
MAKRVSYFAPMYRDEFLKAIGDCRQACIKAEIQGLPLNGDLQKPKES